MTSIDLERACRVRTSAELDALASTGWFNFAKGHARVHRHYAKSHDTLAEKLYEAGVDTKFAFMIIKEDLIYAYWISFVESDPELKVRADLVYGIGNAKLNDQQRKDKRDYANLKQEARNLVNQTEKKMFPVETLSPLIASPAVISPAPSSPQLGKCCFGCLLTTN